MKKKIGVLLGGSGHLDGAEIRESVLALLSLDRLAIKHNLEIQIMAPNQKQLRVMNHLTRKEERTERNVLVEAARIARGQIVDIKEVDSKSLHALVMPGGFGAALNFSNFPEQGAEGQVQDEIARLIRQMHQEKKPIGAICISPALVGLVLGKSGVDITVTLGYEKDNDAVVQMKKIGVHHQDAGPSDICVDKKNLVVTTPAYMHGNASLSEIAEGIDKCCQKVVELLY